MAGQPSKAGVESVVAEESEENLCDFNIICLIANFDDFLIVIGQ